MQHLGTLIVIDGADGAGKATQTKLLVERLRKEGRRVETLSFPQYEHNTFGKLLKECLTGLRGDFSALDARVASTLYAADRFESAPVLRGWLAEGATVILDRYVSSNMLHQGSKIHNDEVALREFLEWNDHVEHTVFGVPRPDTILYLDIPFRLRKELMQADAVRGELDEVEKNEEYQQAAEECSRKLLSSYNTWVPIDCTENSTLRSREAIHELIYAQVERILNHV